MRSLLATGFVLLLALSACSPWRSMRKPDHFRVLEVHSAHWRGSALKGEGTVYTLKIAITRHDPTTVFEGIWIGNEFMKVEARRPYGESKTPVGRGSIYSIRAIKPLEPETDVEWKLPLPEQFEGYPGAAIFKYTVRGKEYFYLVKGFDRFPL